MHNLYHFLGMELIFFSPTWKITRELLSSSLMLNSKLSELNLNPGGFCAFPVVHHLQSLLHFR